MSAERKNGLKPSYKFPVWNGLLEPKHRTRIGPALWEFLWCIDKTTKEKDGVGIVYGGKPVTFAEIAEDLGVSEKTIQRHIDRLAFAGYIELILTPRGQQIRVLKSCKFTKQSGEETQRVTSGLPSKGAAKVTPKVTPSKVSTQVGQKCPTRQDRTVHPPDKSVQPNIREGSLTLQLEKVVREGTASANPAPPAVSLSSLAREKQVPRGKSQAELDARRRELLLQAERIKREHPAKEQSPGNVVEMQPKEAIA